MRENRSQADGRLARLLRCFRHRLLLALLLVAFLAACAPTGGGEGEQWGYDLSDPSFHEGRLWHTDMTRAYGTGQLTTARQLARAHLERDLHLLANAFSRREWEGSIERLIVIESEILHEERRLPPAARLDGRDSELMNFFESALRRTRDSFRVQEFILPENVETQAYYERKLGMAARDWLVTQAEHVSEQELLAIFEEYEEELLEISISDLASALQPLPLMELPTRQSTMSKEPDSSS